MSDEIDVVIGQPTFSSLPSAVSELKKLVANGEFAKIAAAQIIDAIDRQQLWREAGAGSFKEFFPELLDYTLQIGWGSPTQLKRALRVVRAFLNPVNPFTDATTAARMLSHLYALAPVAPYDPKEDALVDGDPPKGKLALTDFEKAFDLINALTSIKKQIAKGDLDTPEKALAVLAPSVAAIYREYFNREPVFTPGQVWKLSNTEELIAFLKDEDDSEKAEKAQRHWVVVEKGEQLLLKTLQFIVGGEVVAEVPVNQWHSLEEAKALMGSDKKTIEA